MNELTLSNKSIKPNLEFMTFLTSASSVLGKIEGIYLQLGPSLVYTQAWKAWDMKDWDVKFKIWGGLPYFFF